MEITKGNQYSVKTRFMAGGVPATFSNPPSWTLYNSLDQQLLTGAAVLDSGYWVATFTIPTNYIVSGGKEKLTVQFEGYDVRSRSYTTDKDVTLIDNSESFLPDGVIYNYITDENITDSLTLESDAQASFEIKIFDPYGTQLGTTVNQALRSADNQNSNGYIFNFSLPKLVITKNTWLDAVSIVYAITQDGITTSEIHPCFILDFKVISVVNSLRTLLDKSKLVEVDPSLQWHDVELIQAVQNGVKRVNSAPPEGTFWKFWDFPSTLDTYLIYAAAVEALNSRLLAEGLNAFDFSGLNTQLNYNRTDVLNTMIGNLTNFLDTLPLAKKSAITVAGKGETTGNEIDQRIRNLGTLGLSINPMNNRVGWGRRQRFW